MCQGQHAGYCCRALIGRFVDALALTLALGCIEWPSRHNIIFSLAVVIFQYCFLPILALAYDLVSTLFLHLIRSNEQSRRIFAPGMKARESFHIVSMLGQAIDLDAIRLQHDHKSH